MAEQMVAIVLPMSHWGVLAEALALDSESGTVDFGLRHEIEEAMDSIEVYTGERLEAALPILRAE